MVAPLDWPNGGFLYHTYLTVKLSLLTVIEEAYFEPIFLLYNIILDSDSSFL